MPWSETAAISLVVLMAFTGVLLTLLTLPGTWLMVLVAMIIKIWQPDMFAWWTIIALSALALIAEAIELLAGAAGAKKVGGSGKAATGAVIGGIVGAILGTLVPVPVIATIVGAVLGAGAGAMIAERYTNKAEWEDAVRIGAGAAVGRLVAVVVKGSLATIMAILMIVAAFVSWA